MNKVKVTYERDRAGLWVASVPAVPGCHTQGRSLHEARERIREALGLFLDDVDHVDLVDDVRLPRDIQVVILDLKSARSRAEQEEARVQHAMRAAALRLVKRLQLSLRDAGELLGLSHQRVQQLVQRERRRAVTAR